MESQEWTHIGPSMPLPSISPLPTLFPPNPHSLSQAYSPASQPIIPPKPDLSSIRVRGSGSRASVYIRVQSLVLPQAASETTGKLVNLSVPQLRPLRKSPSDNTDDSTWRLHPPPLIPVAPNPSQFQAGAFILFWVYICLCVEQPLSLLLENSFPLFKTCSVDISSRKPPLDAPSVLPQPPGFAFIAVLIVLETSQSQRSVTVPLSFQLYSLLDCLFLKESQVFSSLCIHKLPKISAS